LRIGETHRQAAFPLPFDCARWRLPPQQPLTQRRLWAARGVRPSPRPSV